MFYTPSGSDSQGNTLGSDRRTLTWDTEWWNLVSASQEQYLIFFSCPPIEREDKVLEEPRMRHYTRDLTSWTFRAGRGSRFPAESDVRMVQRRPTFAHTNTDNTGTREKFGFFNPKNRGDIDIPWYSWLFFTASSLFISSLSLIPVGIISKFRENKSTHEQRVWILCWMIFGIVIGTLAGWWTSVLDFRTNKVTGLPTWKKLGGKILFTIVFGAPGVGGYIMVGKMMREYGNCVLLF